MALFKNPVGSSLTSKLYVWSQKKDMPSRAEAVITAHGDTTSGDGMRSAPDCSLVFYGPHGRVLNDPRLENVLARLIMPYETVASKASYDYKLSKYTNTSSTARNQHNTAGETYDVVGAMDDRFATAHTIYKETVAMLYDTVMVEDRDDLVDSLYEQTTLEEHYRDLPMDIITVRHRVGQLSPTLSTALKLLSENGYGYEKVHCNFCRGGGASYAPAKVDMSA